MTSIIADTARPRPIGEMARRLFPSHQAAGTRCSIPNANGLLFAYAGIMCAIWKMLPKGSRTIARRSP
jgi:hypothetical protein